MGSANGKQASPLLVLVSKLEAVFPIGVAGTLAALAGVPPFEAVVEPDVVLLGVVLGAALWTVAVLGAELDVVLLELVLGAALLATIVLATAVLATAVLATAVLGGGTDTVPAAVVPPATALVPVPLLVLVVEIEPAPEVVPLELSLAELEPHPPS